MGAPRSSNLGRVPDEMPIDRLMAGGSQFVTGDARIVALADEQTGSWGGGSWRRWE